MDCDDRFQFKFETTWIHRSIVTGRLLSETPPTTGRNRPSPMGGVLSKFWRFAFGDPQRRFKITLISPDNAGKTTALDRLLDGVVVNTSLTVGSNVETIARKNVRLQCWDLAG
jgi:hypothetical protein